MLSGLVPPTSGNAFVRGRAVVGEMHRIYALLGAQRPVRVPVGSAGEFEGGQTARTQLVGL